MARHQGSRQHGNTTETERQSTMAMMTKEQANAMIASGEVRAGIERAFDEAAQAGKQALAEEQPDPVKLMGEAFDRAQERILGRTVIPFRRPGDQR